MAPQRKEKRVSAAAAKHTVPSTTPERSAIRKRPTMITQGQKQALIDNLQLEITERARKLRAQYALQAQSLRTRVELRVNRIPKNLRTARMGDLLTKYTELPKAVEGEAMKPIAKLVTNTTAPQRMFAEGFDTAIPPKPAQSRGTKRTSDIMIAADKENAPDTTHPLPNPKKRTKTTAAAPSRQVTNPACVLSPKSSNSRTLPQSPIRPPFGSPMKPHLLCPVSPLKPASPSKQASPGKHAALAATSSLANLIGEKLKSGRAAATTGRKASKPTTEPKAVVTRAKRGAPIEPGTAENRTISSSSNMSGASTGTTVVKMAAKPAAVAKGGAKRGVGISAAGKKVASTKLEAPATGRRVLRKRA